MKSISNEIHKLSLLLIGDMDVGKTALVKQYKDGTFNEKTNTNALNIFSISKYLKNDKFEGDITIEIYDCSGYSKYNSINIIITQLFLKRNLIFQIPASVSLD